MTARPRALAELSPAHWHVLGLVALHGAGVREAAARLRMPEETTLRLLHEGLQLAGALLSGAGEPHDHADAARLALVR